MRSTFVAVSLALAFALKASTACAQQDNTATVEALFSEGKRLMAAGHTAEACPKFLASYTIERRVGTLLNLAACYEKNGQIASAWARFVEARTLAARNGQTDRADIAGQRATSLEPRRSMLTIVVGTQAPAGLVVKRDGLVVDSAVFGTPVPVDGGSHAIEATAPGKIPLTAAVMVATEGDKKTYALAPLVDAPLPLATAPGANPTTTATTEPPENPSPSHGMSTRSVVGIGVAGAGLVAAGVGAVFGVEALSKNSASNANGDCKGNTCNQVGFDARTTARSDGTLSSILIGAGAAAVVGGVALWLTAPKSAASAANAPRVVVGVGPAGLDVRGGF